MKKVGKVSGQIRLTGNDYEKLREARWNRDKGRCVVCHKLVTLDKGFWHSMHLMHVKSKGSGGSDTLENTRTGCMECHSRSHTEGIKLSA
jgi:5-methylcytosine-specific restriction endonuclease McrA